MPISLFEAFQSVIPFHDIAIRAIYILRSISKLNIHKKCAAYTKDSSEPVASFDLTLAGLEKSALGARRNFQEVLKFQASNEFPAFFLKS